VVDDEAKLTRVLGFAGECPSLKHIVVMDDLQLTAEQQERAAAANIQLHKYKELLASVGETELQEDVPPKPTDNYIIWRAVVNKRRRQK